MTSEFKAKVDFINDRVRLIVYLEQSQKEFREKHPDEYMQDSRYHKMQKMIDAKRFVLKDFLLLDGYCEEAANAIAYRIYSTDMTEETKELMQPHKKEA